MSLTQDIRDAFQRRDNALNQLIIANALVFVVLIILHAVLFVAQATPWYELVLRQVQLSSSLPVLLRHPWTILSYAFVHEGFLHILFNMLNLYWFGRLVQEYLGNRRLVSLYVLGALLGAVFFLAAYNLLPIFRPYMAAGQPVEGASAAVTAIIVAAATLLPDYTFMLILVGPVKIKWIALVVVLISIAGLNGGNPGGEVSHLGGALLGFVFVRQLKAGRDMGAPVQAVGDWLGRLFARRPAPRVTYRATVATPSRPGSPAPAKGSAPSSTSPDEVDNILDKISRSGYESLSKEEKQKLFRASQQ